MNEKPDPKSVPDGHSSVTREQVWAEYVARAAKGDSTALGLLYDETIHVVYGVAHRILGHSADAEEVALDVYSQVWRLASTYDCERAPVLSWLVMLARSRAFDRVRASAAERTLRSSVEVVDDLLTLNSHTRYNEDEFGIRRALDQLPSSDRNLLELAFFQGFSHQELVTELGLPLGTVKSRVRAALTRVRQLMKGHRRT